MANKRLNRTIYMFDDIKTNSVLRCINAMQSILEECNSDEDLKEPIRLVINSSGGDVYDGLALIGHLTTYPIQVDTIALGGRVMSMALPIFLCGEQRTATRYTTFMYHSSAWDPGYTKIEIHRQEIKEVERLDTMIDDLILERTKIKPKMISTYRENNKEWYIPADQAFKLDIVNNLLQ